MSVTAPRKWFSTLGAPSLSISFALYLAALSALGFKWLSPLSGFYERAGWTDLLLALAVTGRLLELVNDRQRPRLRLFHAVLVLYVLAVVASALAADDAGAGAKNVLLVTELAALAALTSHYARDHQRLRKIVLVIAAVSLLSAVLALAGLLLHYAGTGSSLVGAYGEQLVPSHRYARVAAGFATPPLLASFCIFASAVVARRDVDLPKHLRLGIQIALLVVVTLTFSRGLIGFLSAWAICSRRLASAVSRTSGAGGRSGWVAPRRSDGPARPRAGPFTLASRRCRTSYGCRPGGRPAAGSGRASCPGRSGRGTNRRRHAARGPRSATG